MFLRFWFARTCAFWGVVGERFNFSVSVKMVFWVLGPTKLRPGSAVLSASHVSKLQFEYLASLVRKQVRLLGSWASIWRFSSNHVLGIGSDKFEARFCGVVCESRFQVAV